jgi:luciferase family oxidoreductase group 1
MTARALRRTLVSDVDDFPRDVMELMAWFGDPAPNQAVRAVPGQGLKVPLYILGSSTYGAQLAAALGLPFAFASHFAPQDLDLALRLYRARFQPSETLQRPYVMAGLNVFAAPTDAEALRLFTSLQQAFVNLRTGHPAPLPPPVDDIRALYPQPFHGMLDETLSRSVVGGPDTVARGLAAFAARTGANEIVVTTQMFDHSARIRSFEIAADVARTSLAA